MTIGKEIFKLRVSKGISQEKLAGGEFSRSYISQIERGLTLPSSKAIKHIANELCVPTLSLLDSQTIDRIYSKEDINKFFLSARESFLIKDYDTCIKVLPLIIHNETLLDRLDLICGRVWLVESHFKSQNYQLAIDLCDQFFDEATYSRTELAKALKLLHIKGIINYDRGKYHESLSTFQEIEEIIERRCVDLNPMLILDNLSRIQMLYESLGHNDKVEDYNTRIIDLSKKYNLISKGTLRSINRYYRDNSTDSVEDMVDFYESLIETARFIGDKYRVSILHSSIVELYLKHDCLDKLEESLKKEKSAIQEIEDPAYRGYNMAFHHLFKGRYHVKRKMFDKALACYTTAQEFIGDKKYSISIKLEIDSLYNYAELYYEIGQFETAQMYLHMAEAVSLENHTTVRDNQINQLKEQINNHLNYLS